MNRKLGARRGERQVVCVFCRRAVRGAPKQGHIIPGFGAHRTSERTCPCAAMRSAAARLGRHWHHDGTARTVYIDEDIHPVTRSCEGHSSGGCVMFVFLAMGGRAACLGLRNLEWHRCGTRGGSHAQARPREREALGALGSRARDGLRPESHTLEPCSRCAICIQ